MNAFSWALGLVALVVAAVAVVAVRREPRRTLNAPLCGGALVLLVLAGTTSGGNGTLAFAVFALAMLSPLLALGLVGALLLNGLQMIRREGRTLANLLSALTGVALVVAMAVSIGLVMTDTGLGVVISLWIILLVGWLGFLFASMLLYQTIYRVTQPTAPQPDYIVTLGAGLVRGQVGRLLANRVSRAAELARLWTVDGRAPLLIMSGGQGADEPRSEAEAMGDYARAELAVPETGILEEAKSTTTEENLRFTQELVARHPQLGPDARGIAVTSNFHVLRAAELARRQRLDVQVVGAPVARYYWPSAVLREFVAQVLYHRWLFLVTTLLATSVLPVLVFLALQR